MAATVYRRTGTTINSWGAAGIDLVDELNTARQRILSLIRSRSDNFYPTDWTTADLSAGSALPEFDALFHDLIPLWVIYNYGMDNEKENTNLVGNEITTKENQLVRFYGSRNYRIFTSTIATPGVLNRKNHELNSGDRVILSTTGALPTGLAVATWYYVIQSGLDYDNFELSLTKDGTPINTSGSQSGTHYFATDTQQGMERGRRRESNK